MMLLTHVLTLKLHTPLLSTNLITLQLIHGHARDPLWYHDNTANQSGNKEEEEANPSSSIPGTTMMSRLLAFFVPQTTMLGTSDVSWASVIAEKAVLLLEPLMGGPAPFDTFRAVIVWAKLGTRQALRSDDGKGGGVTLLFDLSQDPQERKDLSRERPDKVVPRVTAFV